MNDGNTARVEEALKQVKLIRVSDDELTVEEWKELRALEYGLKKLLEGE